MKRYRGIINVVIVIILFFWLLAPSYSQSEFDKFKSTYDNYIRNHQFFESIKLCKDTLKKPRITQDEKQRAELEALLDDALRQQQVFS